MSDNDTDFEDVLTGSFENDEEPGLWPQGTWRVRILGAKLLKGSEEQKYLAKGIFLLQPVEPRDDVSPAEIEAVGDLKAVRGTHGITVFTKGDYWNIRKFLDTIGVVYSGVNREEAVALAKGYEFETYVKHSLDKKNPEKTKDRPYVNFTNVKAITA